jgi:hypothetical protein
MPTELKVTDKLNIRTAYNDQWESQEKQAYTKNRSPYCRIYTRYKMESSWLAALNIGAL